MTTTYDVADKFLADIGAPRTAGMRRAVAIWLTFESGGRVTGNNPWNLHSGPACTASSGYCPGQGSLPGQIGNRYAGSGDKNVAVFGTLDQGVQASVNNLSNVSGAGYGSIISAARAGNPVGFLAAVQASKWSAGHYGYSKLVQAYINNTDYNKTLTETAVGGGSGAGTTYTGPTLADALGHDVKLSSPSQIMQIAASLAGLTGKSPQDLYVYLIDFDGKNASQIPFNYPGVPGYNAAQNSDQSGPSSQDPITAVGTAITGVGDALTKLAGFAGGLVLIGLGVFIYTRSARQNVNVTEAGAAVA